MCLCMFEEKEILLCYFRHELAIAHAEMPPQIAESNYKVHHKMKIQSGLIISRVILR
jgi:hypothetical protein